MVTVICTTDACPSKNQTFNIAGNPAFVECGGCATQLEPKDPRPDLEEPTT